MTLPLTPAGEQNRFCLGEIRLFAIGNITFFYV